MIFNTRPNTRLCRDMTWDGDVNLRVCKQFEGVAELEVHQLVETCHNEVI